MIMLLKSGVVVVLGNISGGVPLFQFAEVCGVFACEMFTDWTGLIRRRLASCNLQLARDLLVEKETAGAGQLRWIVH